MRSKTAAVGRVVKAHGIRGEVAVEVWLEVGEALSPGAPLWLEWQDGKRREGRVATVRPHGERRLVRLEGVSDRNEAEALVHAEIRVPRDSLPPLGEGEYLWEDLVGLEVVDLSGRRHGRLTEVFAAGPGGENVVIVVRAPRREILLPMTREVILEVDLEGRRMRVSVPAGLEEAGRKDVDL